MVRFTRLRTALLATLLLLGSLVLVASVSDSGKATLARESAAGEDVPVQPQKPNIVFVLTDDMRKDDLRFVPRTQQLMSGSYSRMLEFENAFVSTSWCCPSRASFLTGDYPHNHQVRDNNVGPREPNGVPGGFGAFRDGAESRSIGIFMQQAGYRTFFGGKYFNNYGRDGTGTYVPPGWDSWHGRWPGAEGSVSYRGGWNDDGAVSSLAEQGEDEDTTPDEVLGQKASSFVRETEDPFFAVLSTLAPHREGGGPGATYKVDPEAQNLYADEQAPRDPAYDEANVSDKASWLSRREPLTEEQKNAIDQQHRERARTLYSVDDMMEKLYASLEERGELDNTYVFFTSDHGISLGAHRLPGKGHYFEQDIRVPLLVSMPAGLSQDPVNSRKQLILNTDFAPTFLDLAGASVPTAMDGTSFAPLLKDGAADTPWRGRILVENERAYGRPEYDALRSQTTKLVRFPASKQSEVYRLERDPFELNSRRNLSPSWTAFMNEKLQALMDCAGEECRKAEGFPKP